ncbi:MAG: hypothetical protein JW969_05610 [Spirochaetales bacterium]|nr:hypothetical protein [Spirochaetales bacterium]
MTSSNFVLMITGLKTVITIVTFSSFIAVFNFVFSKGILMWILVSTFSVSEANGIKINLKNGIFMLVLPGRV